MKKAILIASFAALAITGCTVHPTFSPSQEKAVVDSCMQEVQAPGTYSISPAQATSSNNPEGALPRARPVETLGGTAYGAAAINSCIKRRAGL